MANKASAKKQIKDHIALMQRFIDEEIFSPADFINAAESADQISFGMRTMFINESNREIVKLGSEYAAIHAKLEKAKGATA